MNELNPIQKVMYVVLVAGMFTFMAWAVLSGFMFDYIGWVVDSNYLDWIFG